MPPLSSDIRLKGLVNFPGISSESKKCAEDLLQKDAESHHCYFNNRGFHNHVSHYVLAAYDLGASATLLEKIYQFEAKPQRSLFSEETDKDINVTPENWLQYVGNSGAYGSFFKFFTNEIKSHGVVDTVKKYIFDEKVNKGSGMMLIRLVGGALHPFIQIGYGIEFGNDAIAAAGLAQTAIHQPTAETVFDFFSRARSESETTSLLESEKLHPPMPYDPDAFVNARIRVAVEGEKSDEIRRIFSFYHVHESLKDEDWNKRAEEIIWLAILLTFATGKHGRKPRLDFFFMHLATSSIFIPTYFRVFREPSTRAMLLRAYVPVMIVFILARGRPRIDPELVMTYTDKPRPPRSDNDIHLLHESAVGSPGFNANYNPWPEMIQASLYYPDAHFLKVMRTLVYATQQYGDVATGRVLETHHGSSKLNGTLFVRAAGVLLDTMGWVTFGQKAKDWDRSALGWDAAWD
ncbi:hypothetical protein BDQ17DRAFT_1480126 [Cyathus striatus]|nr:hypothetical protein BDQ17DRAFT_1480126 [Cyathus striatus]